MTAPDVSTAPTPSSDRVEPTAWTETRPGIWKRAGMTVKEVRYGTGRSLICWRCHFPGGYTGGSYDRAEDSMAYGDEHLERILAEAVREAVPAQTVEHSASAASPERVELPGGYWWEPDEPMPDFDVSFGRIKSPDGTQVSGGMTRPQALALALAFATALRSGAAAGVPEGQRWRHLSLGTEYVEVGRAEYQQSWAEIPALEGDTLVIYRSTNNKLRARREGEFEDGRFEKVAAAPEPPAPKAEGEATLAEACNPWRLHSGEPPDDDSPLSSVFGAGMAYSERLLAQLLGVSRYEGGDGSEDFDQDATKTLENILTAAHLHDPENGRWATLPPIEAFRKPQRRYDAVETALRDLRNEVIMALERNPRIIVATKIQLDRRLQEATDAINMMEDER